MSGLSQKSVSENSPAAERTNLYSGHANVYPVPAMDPGQPVCAGLIFGR